MNAKCVTVTRKGKFEVIIMIKSLVVLLLFALVIYAFLTFIYFVFDVLKWHDNEKKEEIIPSAANQTDEHEEV